MQLTSKSIRLIRQLQLPIKYMSEKSNIPVQENREDVSIIGRYDDDWGEIVIAYYVGTATPEELDKHCLNHIARFKRPKEYIAIDSLPKSHYGKILKSELREIDRNR